MHLENVVNKYCPCREETRQSLSAMKVSKSIESLESTYEHGPLLKAHDPETVLRLWDLVVEMETSQHMRDLEMSDVTITFSIDKSPVYAGTVDFLISFSGGDKPGSVSFSLTCAKEHSGAYLVFGDEDYRSAAISLNHYRQ